jgi:hypothetical protein
MRRKMGKECDALVEKVTGRKKVSIRLLGCPLVIAMGMSINYLARQCLGLPGNWFWWVGSVARRFYCLKASLNDSFLERFPTFSKKEKKKGYPWVKVSCI